MMSVPVEASGRNWKAAEPVTLFHGGYYTRGTIPPRMYDVSPDGKRFLMLKALGSDQTGTPSIVIMQNFGEELKRLVPVN